MVVYVLYYDPNSGEDSILIGFFSDFIKMNEFTKKEFGVEFDNDVDVDGVDIPTAVYGESLYYNKVETNKIVDGIIERIRKDMVPYEEAEK